MLVGIKKDGAPTAFEDHLLGTDWSQRRLTDGRQTMTPRPFAFPLDEGKSWDVDYVDPTRRGNQVSVHVRRTYKVAGKIGVDVPADHFQAIKVTSDGVDDLTLEIPASASGNVMASSVGSTSTTQAWRGGTRKVARVCHSEFYYVPEIRNYVRSIEEIYNSDNVLLTRQRRELVGFTPAPS